MEKDHEEARHIAEESMVLLKNDVQILPLKASEKVAFIGGLQRSLVSKVAEALISTASRSQMHWIPFLPMHRLLMQKVFLQTKISTMTHLQLKRSKLLPPLTRL